MKTLLIFCVIATAIVACKVNNSNKAELISKIDSTFNSHYNILNSIASLKDGETIEFKEPVSIGKSIRFFEELTNIKSKAIGSTFGKQGATSEDLKIWKEWYLKNKSDLRWNEKEYKIECDKCKE